METDAVSEAGEETDGRKGMEDFHRIVLDMEYRKKLLEEM